MTCIHRMTVTLIVAGLLSQARLGGSSHRLAAENPRERPARSPARSERQRASDGKARVTAKLETDTALTGSRWRYAIRVPVRERSGRLVFDNGESIPYTNVTSDIIDGKPAASSIVPPAPPSSGGPEYPQAIVPSPAGNAS